MMLVRSIVRVVRFELHERDSLAVFVRICVKKFDDLLKVYANSFQVGFASSEGSKHLEVL